jgi:uncharacterized membrane protein (UPF0127 family)
VDDDAHPIVDRDSGAVVVERCVLADSSSLRLRGLLGRSELPAGDGLLIRPAPAVHTAFMRFAIDVVFVDRDLTVVKIAENVRPWRAVGCRGAKAVLELGSGESRRLGLEPGRRLQVGAR